MAKSTTTALIAGIALVAGLAGGYGAGYLLPMPSASEKMAQTMDTASPPGGPAAPSQPSSTTPATAKPAIKWRMISTYAGDLPILGTLGKRLSDSVRTASDQTLDITFYEPDVLMPPLKGFDAVANGEIDAVWGSSAYWDDKIPAAQWFTGTPFGPRAEGLLAWLSFGGGQELWDEIYAAYGVKAIACGVAPPDAAGWFREPIDTAADFKDKTIRIFGYGAPVVERLGATALRTPSVEIASGLADGSLDGAEFSSPAIDIKAGFDKVAKYYYFPGWQQGAALLELLVNKKAYDALPASSQAALKLACGDNVRRGLAEGSALQAQALQQLEKSGVVVSRLSDDVLVNLKAAWEDVIREKSAENKDFARAARSVRAFRQRYDTWEKIGYTH